MNSICLPFLYLIYLNQDHPLAKPQPIQVGSTSKGRSSSKQLNFYLGSTLPYIMGGDLYPYLLARKKTPSNDISCFVQLRISDGITSLWLQSLLDGDTRLFDQVVEADNGVDLSGFL